MRRATTYLSAPFALLLALATVAGTSLLGTLVGSSVYWVSLIGALVAGSAALVGQRFRLLTAEWVALSVFLLFVVGAFVSSGSIRPDPIAFFDSLVQGWADLLSSVPPVRADNQYRVLPYALSWLAGTGGLAFARHVRIPAVAAVWPLSVFGLGLLFSVELRTTALVQGGLLTMGTLALGWCQQREFGFESDLSLGTTTRALKRTRAAQAGVVLVLVALSAPFLAPHSPGFEERARFDLRDRLEPPWNPLDEPSPLAALKENYVDEARSTVVFEVSGDNIPARWRLASLGVFDGTVWTVGDTAVGGLAPFVQIDELLPPDPQWINSDMTLGLTNQQTYAVDVKVLDSPWLPMPANPLSISSDQDLPDIRWNTFTRTAARPAGATGFGYSVQAQPERDYTDADLLLEEATFPFPAALGLSQQARTVKDWSADLVETRDRGWLQIEAIRDELTGNGFYLADDAALPGHSWARLTRFFSNEVLFGYEEQYAAAAAIAARNAELPARVVVGYLIDEGKLGASRIEVTRGEASAWIEVLSNEYGWIPVDVTPVGDELPPLSDPNFQTESVASPNPPPPPPPPSEVEVEPNDLTVDLPPEVPEDPLAPRRVPVGVLLGGAASIPIVLAGALAASIVLRKNHRRRRREHAGLASHRIAGAWDEANDRLVEAGLITDRPESVTERAKSLPPATGAERSVQLLARAVDRTAFGPHEPTPAAADQAWVLYDDISSNLQDGTSWIERASRRLSRAPLKRKATLA